MSLFGQEQKYEEIDFEDIDNKYKEIVKPYNSSESFDLNVLLLELIELEKTILNKKGKHKNRIEDKILSSICVFYFDIISEFKFENENLDKSLITRTKNQELKKVHLTSLEIFNFIEVIFGFKMERDNYSSKRKAHAVALLCFLLREYQINNEFDIFRNVLKSGKDILLIRTFEELELLLKESNKHLPEDIVQTLYQLIKKTKNRSVVIGCLNILMTINEESEGSALMIIDEWKERKYY